MAGAVFTTSATSALQGELRCCARASPMFDRVGDDRNVPITCKIRLRPGIVQKENEGVPKCKLNVDKEMQTRVSVNLDSRDDSDRCRYYSEAGKYAYIYIYIASSVVAATLPLSTRKAMAMMRVEAVTYDSNCRDFSRKWGHSRREYLVVWGCTCSKQRLLGTSLGGRNSSDAIATTQETRPSLERAACEACRSAAKDWCRHWKNNLSLSLC